MLVEFNDTVKADQFQDYSQTVKLVAVNAPANIKLEYKVELVSLANGGVMIKFRYNITDSTNSKETVVSYHSNIIL